MLELAVSAVLSYANVDCRSLKNYDHVNTCEVALVETVQEENYFVVCEKGMENCLVLTPYEFIPYYKTFMEEFDN